jgi:predicted DNA-binding protein
MITIDTLDSAEELEIISMAHEAGKNAGQLAAEIIREYLEDRHDAAIADAALADIQDGKAGTVSWRMVKAELYDDMEH